MVNLYIYLIDLVILFVNYYVTAVAAWVNVGVRTTIRSLLI